MQFLLDEQYKWPASLVSLVFVLFFPVVGRGSLLLNLIICVHSVIGQEKQ